MAFLRRNDVVFIRQGTYISFDIGSAMPYKIFKATPLISCFAFLFQYSTNKDEKKRILYHAPVGILEEKQLNEIIQLIKKDSKLSEVKIVITPSGESLRSTLEQAKEKLESCGFTNSPVINKNSPIYCADTLGQHGIVISKESAVKTEVTPNKPPSPRSSSDNDFP